MRVLKRLEAGGYKKRYMYPMLAAVSALNFYRLLKGKDTAVDVGVNHIHISLSVAL